MASQGAFPRVAQWVKEYGISDVPDQRAVETFLSCENSETVQIFKNELMAIRSGHFVEENLDITVGMKRRLRWGTYHEWARMMIMWLSASQP